jgi:hypothetical protein
MYDVIWGLLTNGLTLFIYFRGFKMFKKFSGAVVASTLAFSAGIAGAANNTAILTINQADGTNWQEDVSGLLLVNAQNNFSLVQGGNTTGLFQNGSFVTAIDSTVHPDFWQWKVDAVTSVGSWNWHSAQTNSGATPGTTTAADPWMSSLTLASVSGHGDPDLSYAFSANNNNTTTQTYFFSIGEAIIPPVGSAHLVHADIAGALTAKAGGAVKITPFGTSTTIQQFQLSADNGLTFVNAGVDVGPMASGSSTTTYGTYNNDAIGPTAKTWNYMQLVSKFTLSAKSSASLVGFASITPVPEAETYAMLLVGLGLLGVVARRRSQI